ncbi:MAG: FHA domain-containing protein, partial [Myxococcota bacterium]|nr:FHA domain-containing protein [Myxococcota bacterium]
MTTAIPPVKFDIYDGEQLLHTEVLADQTIKIGKLSSSHIRLDDDAISRMHAVVEVHDAGDVSVFDLGSETGTWVNGERITRHRLKSGDRITIGRFTVVVTLAKVKGQASPGAATSRPVAENIPLFDEEESGDGRRSLEVLGLWGNTVTDVKHINETGRYVLGDDTSVDYFVEPGHLPEAPYTLAETDGSMMVVNVPHGVTGEVMLDGEVFSLEELKAAGKLSQGSMANSDSLRLPPRGRCRIRFGQHIFLVNSVPAAKRVGAASVWAALDPQLMRYLFSAAALHALFFFIVLSIPANADQLGLDGFDLSDRFVEFILKPEEEMVKTPEDLFKDMDEGKKSKKAKEESGEMGDRQAKDKDRRMAIEGPQDNKELELAKQRARQEAIDTAQAALNQIDNQLSAVWGSGDTAIGNEAVSALGNMYGDKVGAANGFGGLGLAGAGRGGGGLGNSIGVGSVGTYGRGKGGRGYGRGASRLGAKGNKVPKVIP